MSPDLCGLQADAILLTAYFFRLILSCSAWVHGFLQYRALIRTDLKGAPHRAHGMSLASGALSLDLSPQDCLQYIFFATVAENVLSQ